MSAQVLSARSLRRIERAIGEPVLRGWGHGGYVLGFVTPDHRHGWYDKKTGQVEWPDEVMHYTSCDASWPGFDGRPPRVWPAEHEGGPPDPAPTAP